MHSTRSRLFLVIVGAILATGCSGSSGGSGGGGGGGTEPQGKLSIAYTALTTKVGDQVALTAHLENASGDVAWSLDGVGALSAVAGQEITYQATAEGTAAVSAAAAGLTAAVTIHVLPGGGNGGNGGNGGCTGAAPTGTSSTGCVDPVDPTITVTGLVLNENGYPVINQNVFVLGMPPPTTATDATGHFTIAGVTTPYDLAMVVDATNTVYVYRGLTRADPTLYVKPQIDDTNWLPRQVTLNGTIQGGGLPFPSDLLDVGFVSPDVDRTLNLNQVSAFSPGQYQLTVPWNGPAVTTGTLVGIQVRRNLISGAPIDYWYDAQPGVILLDNPLPEAGPTLTLMPAATANTEGDITLADDYSITQKLLGLSFEKGVFFEIFKDTLSIATPSFKYVAPDIANTTTQVCVEASNTVPPSLKGDSTTCLDALAPESSGAGLKILAAPQPFAPANGANAVTASTVFSWSPFEGGVYAVEILPTSPSNPTYRIFTAGTSTTVPNVDLVGLAFGTDNYTWNVTGFAPFATLDDFTAGIPAAATYVAGAHLGKAPPVPNASTGVGDSRTFTHPY